MPYILDLTAEPWDYLLKVIDDPNIKLGKIRLWLSFRLLLNNLKTNYTEIRYISIPTRKYLEFACYFAGLIAMNSEYQLATPAIVITDESGMLFANTYPGALAKARALGKWGNKYIDSMLSSLRH